MRQSILTTCGQWVVTGLVMVGLLLTPVSCTLVDHPHSLFDTPDALERSSHAAHTAHAGASHAAHTAMMVNGAPPLAGPIPLPDLHPGTVVAWLTANPSVDAGLVARGVRSLPGFGGLPAVSAAAMAMVASGQTALHVTLVLLLAVTLIARRPVALAVALPGRSLATIAPPPKRFAVI